jgi:hypothetical protein
VTRLFFCAVWANARVQKHRTRQAAGPGTGTHAVLDALKEVTDGGAVPQIDRVRLVAQKDGTSFSLNLSILYEHTLPL